MTIAEIKTALTANAAARKMVADALKAYGTRNCAAVTRLNDKRHDLEARNAMLCRIFDTAAQ